MSLQIEQIADAIAAIARDVDRVDRADVGPQTDLPGVVTAEVLALGWSVQTLAAGAGGGLLERVDLQVSFMAPLFGRENPNIERLLMRTATAFVETLRATTFDHSLGGLVEDTRTTGADWGVLERNSVTFRYVVVDIHAGNLDNL